MFNSKINNISFMYEKIYGVIQKYIAKTDEFSGALLWVSIKYSSPIS